MKKRSRSSSGNEKSLSRRLTRDRLYRTRYRLGRCACSPTKRMISRRISLGRSFTDLNLQYLDMTKRQRHEGLGGGGECWGKRGSVMLQKSAEAVLRDPSHLHIKRRPSRPRTSTSHETLKSTIPLVVTPVALKHTGYKPVYSQETRRGQPRSPRCCSVPVAQTSWSYPPRPA